NAMVGIDTRNRRLPYQRCLEIGLTISEPWSAHASRLPCHRRETKLCDPPPQGQGPGVTAATPDRGPQPPARHAAPVTATHASPGPALWDRPPSPARASANGSAAA